MALHASALLEGRVEAHTVAPRHGSTAASRSPAGPRPGAEDLLRDLAFVYHATRVVREALAGAACRTA
jgi:hypothetical protein